MDDVGYFLIFDFDGTAANTFEPSPNNIGVNEAYEQAIFSIFGPAGSEAFQMIGGLQNRSPSEVITEMCKTELEEKLFYRATATWIEKQKFFRTELGFKDNPIIIKWLNGQGAKLEELLTELLVLFKINCLTREINENWPQPCQGFPKFWKTIQNLKKGIKLTTAILSSGHTDFIKKTFQVWQIPLPDLILTDDEMRYSPLPEKNKIKPSPSLVWTLQRQWLQKMGLKLDMELLEQSNRFMTYVGDDPKKDGEMAYQADIPFGWFRINPENDEEKRSFLSHQHHYDFSDWEIFSNYLNRVESRTAMRSRKPLNQILPKF